MPLVYSSRFFKTISGVDSCGLLGIMLTLLQECVRRLKMILRSGRWENSICVHCHAECCFVTSSVASDGRAGVDEPPSDTCTCSKMK